MRFVGQMQCKIDIINVHDTLLPVETFKMPGVNSCPLVIGSLETDVRSVPGVNRI